MKILLSLIVFYSLCACGLVETGAVAVTSGSIANKQLDGKASIDKANEAMLNTNNAVKTQPSTP